jgi:hypothetical protein
MGRTPMAADTGKNFAAMPNLSGSGLVLHLTRGFWLLVSSQTSTRRHVPRGNGPDLEHS